MGIMYTLAQLSSVRHSSLRVRFFSRNGLKMAYRRVAKLKSPYLRMSSPNSSCSLYR